MRATAARLVAFLTRQPRNPVALVRPRLLLRAPQRRRFGDTKKPKPVVKPEVKPDEPKTKAKKMSKVEVDRLAQQARSEQKLWAAMTPENNITFTSPLFWLLLAGCVGLHFWNGANEQAEEKKAREEDELLRKAEETSRRKREARKLALESDSLDPTLLLQSAELRREAEEALAFKRKQLSQWEAKLQNARQTQNSAQIDVADHRIEELQRTISVLESNFAMAGISPR